MSARSTARYLVLPAPDDRSQARRRSSLLQRGAYRSMATSSKTSRYRAGSSDKLARGEAAMGLDHDSRGRARNPLDVLLGDLLEVYGRAIGQSGDEGIDGIITEDRLGLDVVYIQAKKWEAAVGRPEIQKFAGALQGQRARKGVFITTSTFSSDARAFAANIESKIILIDGEQLVQFMFDHNVGVSPSSTYEVKKVDADLFDEE